MFASGTASCCLAIHATKPKMLFINTTAGRPTSACGETQITEASNAVELSEIFLGQDHIFTFQNP